MTEVIPNRDSLLTFARLLVGAIIGLLIFALVMIAIGIGALLTVQRDEMLANLQEAGYGGGAFPLMILGFTILVGLMLIAIQFMRRLLAIVRSVEEGEPFQPANADRLRQMAWLSVVALPMYVLLIGLGLWFARGEGDLLRDASGTIVNGLVLTLVLFILARVFRVGTAMREELDGTV